MKKLLSLLMTIFFLLNAQTVFAAENTSWDDLNPPQWLKDVRRTEIITFGSLPFATLWTTLGYSLAVKGKFTNPLDKSTSAFSEDDQWNIIKISAATCVGLGLFDLSFNLIKRAVKNSKNDLKKGGDVQVYPFSTKEKEKIDMEEDAFPPLPEYFNCGIENAVF